MKQHFVQKRFGQCPISDYRENMSKWYLQKPIFKMVRAFLEKVYK